MASKDDENLVSQVQITGTDESAAALEKYADRGAAAFGKLDKAAVTSAAAIKGATADIEGGTKDAGAALDDLGSKKVDTGQAAKLRDIGKAAFDLGNEVRKTIKDVAQFITRVAALGAAAGAASAGVLKLASSVAKQAQGTSDALDKQAQAQTAANDRQLEAVSATINLASSQRKLFQQFQQGAIDFQTYQANLKALNQDYAEARRVQGELANAADATRDANERLQKQLADRKAYQALIDTWGGPMLSALTALGNEVNREWQLFKNAFGPPVAALIDLILGVLTKNAGAIGKFFDEGSKKIDEFVKNNGPAIQQALTSIGEIAASIFNGLIAAMPTLLALFNNGIVPAIKLVGSTLQGVADAWNAVFGTDATAGVVAAVLAVGTMTGAFKVLIGVINVARAAVVLLNATFGIWGIAIAAIVIALGLIATQIDWSAWAATAVAAGTSLLSWFQAFPDNLAIVWEAIKKGWSDLWNGAIQIVKDLFAGFLAFFTSFPGNLQIVWDTIKQAIIDAFNAAVTSVKQYLSDLATSAMSLLQPIIDALKTIIGLNGQADAGGSGGQSFARGGPVRGKGTSTSDSIAAWLSNNEFVMRAKAVRKYGTSFMDAINRGDLDPSQIIRRAAGGLVSSFSQPRVSMAPVAIASGGSTAASRILNLTIGDQSFNGLMAPEDVADRMERFATGRYARSAGRKPSWVGGTR